MIKSMFNTWRATLAIRVGVGLVLCSNYSCSTYKKVVEYDPFRNQQPYAQNDVLNDVTRSVPVTHAAAMQTQEQLSQPVASQVAQVSLNESVNGNPVYQEWPALPEKTIGIKRPQLAESTPKYHYTTPTSISEGQQIVQTAYQSPVPQPNSEKASPTEFTPAEPRIQLASQSARGTTYQGVCPPVQACPPGNHSPGACPTSCGPGCLECVSQAHPDEYICDGGDRQLPVHYNNEYRHGFDTEDTIAEYQDHTGKAQLNESNQVCVYSPRFAAVRSESGIEQNLNVDRALGAYETVNGSWLQSELIPNTEQKSDQIVATRVRSRASGLETESITGGVEQVNQVTDHTDLQNLHQEYAVAGSQRFDHQSIAAMMEGIQSATVWTRKQSPVIMASLQAGSETYSWFRPEEMVGLEDRRQEGDLEIIKMADRRDAQPGDIITFTIRYRNTGDFEFQNVNVLDNLTPRLEYIEGSATSDRAGRLITEDNAEGSLILKWEFSEPLPGRTGGEVSFQARVR